MKENKSLELHNKLFGSNDPENNKKRFPWFFVISIALLIAAIILLSSFLSSYFSIVHFQSPDRGITLVDSSKDVRYTLAPMCYEPIEYLTEPYAEYDERQYYAVNKADPLEYVCTIDDNIYDLYYSEDIRLPTLKEFGANYIRVCKVAEKAIMLRSVEKEVTEEIVEYFLSAETTDSALISNIKNTLYIKFMSDEYNFMYYVITYYETEDGGRYLFDRSTGRCVSIGDLFKDDL